MINIIPNSKRKSKNREYIVDAICVDCSKQFTIHCKYVKTATGKCPSCRTTKHGLYGTRAYWAWSQMKKRCDNKKEMFYNYYGGRGITYNPEWKHFEKFYKDMGDCPDNLELDRIDSNGNYCKENCRWTTRHQQMRNMRRNRWIEYNGERKVITDWAKQFNTTPTTISGRIKRGWSIDEVMSGRKK